MKTVQLVSEFLSQMIYLQFYSQDSSSQTDQEKQQQCAYLNSIRANFTTCCQYPILVIWYFQFQECLASCGINENSTETAQGHCCIQVCCYNKIGLLNPVYNDDGSQAPSEVDWRGLVYSFMLSVGNDTQWLPVVNASSYRCYTQYSESNNGYACEVIPLNLFTVINCGYDENFLKCPPWNPNNVPACTYTWQYVSQCGDS